MPAGDDIHFEPNPNIDAEIRDLPMLAETSVDIANNIAEVARGNAPHDSDDYADGIVVQKTKHGARVLASDYKSAWLEFGVPSRGVPARWILRRAVEAAGYKFRKRS